MNYYYHLSCVCVVVEKEGDDIMGAGKVRYYKKNADEHYK